MDEWLAGEASDFRDGGKPRQPARRAQPPRPRRHAIAQFIEARALPVVGYWQAG
jgi:hypothetical protein